MIVTKCTNKECRRKFTDEDIANLRNDGTKITQKCSYCNSDLTSNISDKYGRKKWYGYLNKDKTSIEYLVLVIIDQFEDYSAEVEIPLLEVCFEEVNQLSAMQKASNEISNFLSKKYGKSFAPGQQFITIAFHGEDNPIKNDIPVWW